MNQSTNIEEELSALWLRIYADIVNVVKENSLTNKNIKLYNCVAKSLIVDEEGIILLIDHNNGTYYAEDYEDQILYGIHEQIVTNMNWQLRK